MRRQRDEPLAFGEALTDEIDLTIFQVAKAAVHEAGRPGGGATGEIVSLHHNHIHAGEHELAGQGSAIDTATEDCNGGGHLSHEGLLGVEERRGERGRVQARRETSPHGNESMPMLMTVAWSGQPPRRRASPGSKPASRSCA